MKYYAIISTSEKSIQSEPFICTNDNYINQLAFVFCEGYYYPNALKNELLRVDMQDSGGFGGNVVDIQWDEKWVYIGQQFDYSQINELPRLIKEKLLKLIDDFYEVMKKDPEHLVLCRDDDFNLWFETELPDFEANRPREGERYTLYNPPDLD